MITKRINAGFRNAQYIIWDLLETAESEMQYHDIEVIARYLFKARHAALSNHVDLYHTSQGFED